MHLQHHPDISHSVFFKGVRVKWQHVTHELSSISSCFQQQHRPLLVPYAQAIAWLHVPNCIHTSLLPAFSNKPGPTPLLWLSLFMILVWNTSSNMVLTVTHFSHEIWRMDFNVISLGLLRTEQLVYPIIICHVEHTKRKSLFNFVVVVVLAHADHFILLQEIMQCIMTYS